MVEDAATVATRDGNPGPCPQSIYQIDNDSFAVISLRISEAITRRDEPVSGGNASFAVLGFCSNQTSGEQRKNSGRRRCSRFAKPSAAQDFRGEGDVDG
jgi:hypothetical protein